MDDTEFLFDDERPDPLEEALEGYGPGDRMDACTFLALTVEYTDAEAEEAALSLNRRGIGLDVASLPKGQASGALQQRQALELALLQRGQLPRGLDPTDPLRLLLQDIAAAPHLSWEAADTLYEKKGAEALPELAMGCLWLVEKLARDYLGWGVLLEDLIQEGSLGLWQLETIDGNFSQAAETAVQMAMERAVTLQARAAGLGQELVDAMEAYRKADRALLAQLGRNPTAEDLAQALQMPEEQVTLLGEMVKQADRQAKKAQNAEAEQEEAEQSVEDTAYYQLRSQVEALLSQLPQQDRDILTLRFGLDGKEAMDVSKTAAALGIDPGTVLDREYAALKKLRAGS